jgi:hypothetical protein
MSFRIFAPLLFLIGGPAVAAAQADPDSVQLRNNCRLAEQVIATGHPEPQDEWAWGVIHQCGGSGGAAIAQGMAALRQSADLEALDRLTGQAQWLRDGHMFDTALDIAGDASASVPARVLAMRSLLYYLRLEHPTNRGVPITYGDMHATADPRTGVPRQGCASGVASSHASPPAALGDPLPPDYGARVEALGIQLSRDAAEPPEVRAAALCLL